VAIVGAGFAGLTAALKLVEAGRSVIVLEARGGVPTGEVLKLSYWIAQMHLWVAEHAPKPATVAAANLNLIHPAAEEVPRSC